MVSKKLSFVAGLLEIIAGAALIAAGLCALLAAIQRRQRWE